MKIWWQLFKGIFDFLGWWQTWYFATFSARFRIFWKWCLENCKIFWYDHSNACQKRPNVSLHNTPKWNGAKQKIQFFQFFQKQCTILLFECFTYIKNVIFWGASCWCSSKFDIVWGGAHKLQSQLLSPPLETQFLSYISMMYLKRSYLLWRKSIQSAKLYFFFKKLKKNEFSVLLHFKKVCYVVNLWDAFGRH